MKEGKDRQRRSIVIKVCRSKLQFKKPTSIYLEFVFYISVIHQIACEDIGKTLKSLNPSKIRESVRKLNVKTRLLSIAFCAATVMTLAINIRMGLANPMPTGGQIIINPQPPIGQKLPASTIYGTVKLLDVPANWNKQCQDFTVYLFSEKKINDKNIFSRSAKMTGKFATGQCNYIISTDTKFIGEKATLEFGSSGLSTSDIKHIKIPNQPMKLDTQVDFFVTPS